MPNGMNANPEQPAWRSSLPVPPGLEEAYGRHGILPGRDTRPTIPNNWALSLDPERDSPERLQRGAAVIMKEWAGITSLDGRIFSGREQKAMDPREYYKLAIGAFKAGSLSSLFSPEWTEFHEAEAKGDRTAMRALAREKIKGEGLGDKARAVADKNVHKQSADELGAMRKALGTVKDAMSPEDADLLEHPYRLGLGYVQGITALYQKYHETIEDEKRIDVYRKQLADENQWAVIESIKGQISDDARRVLEMALASADDPTNSAVRKEFQKLTTPEQRSIAGSLQALHYDRDPSFKAFLGDVGTAVGKTLEMVTGGAARGFGDYFMRTCMDREEYRDMVERRVLLEDANRGRMGDWGIVGNSVIGAAGTIPYMAAAAIPYVGIADVMLAAKDEFQSEAMRNGVDVSSLDFILGSSAFAIAYAYVEKLEFNTAFGGLKNLSKRQMYCDVFHSVRSALGVAGSYAGNVLTQSGQEGVQAALEETVAKWGKGTMPDAVGAFTRDFVESLGTMAIIGGVGSVKQGIVYRHGALGYDKADALAAQSRILELDRHMAGHPGDVGPLASYGRTYGRMVEDWLNAGTDADARQATLRRWGLDAEQAQTIHGALQRVWTSIEGADASAERKEEMRSALVGGGHVLTPGEVIAQIQNGSYHGKVETLDDGSQAVDLTIGGKTLRMVVDPARTASEIDPDNAAMFESIVNALNERNVLDADGAKFTVEGWKNLTPDQRKSIIDANELRNQGDVRLFDADGKPVASMDGRVLDAITGKVQLTDAALPQTAFHETMHGVLNILTNMAAGEKDDAGGWKAEPDKDAASLVGELAKLYPAQSAREAVNEEALADAFQAYLTGKIDVVEHTGLLDRLGRFLARLFGHGGATHEFAKAKTAQQRLFNTAITGHVAEALQAAEAETASQEGDQADTQRDQAPAQGDQGGAAAPSPVESVLRGIETEHPELAETVAMFRNRDPLTGEQMQQLRDAGDDALDDRAIWNAGYRWNEAQERWDHFDKLDGTLDERDAPEAATRGSVAPMRLVPGADLADRQIFDEFKRAMSVEHPIPNGESLLPKDATPQEALAYFERNILGKTITTPDGERITLEMGHFFRLVCDGSQGKKGWVAGYNSSAEALAAIRRGDVPPERINGYHSDRAEVLPLFIDTVEHPAFELQDKAHPEKTQFVKRFAADDGRGVVAVFRFMDGGRRIQTYHGFSRRYGKLKQYRIAQVGNAVRRGASPDAPERSQASQANPSQTPTASDVNSENPARASVSPRLPSPEFAMDGTIADALPAHLREDTRAIIAERAGTPAWMIEPDGTLTELNERDWLRREAEKRHEAGRRFAVSGLYTGSAADYAQRDEEGNIVNGPSLHHVGTGEGNQVFGWGLYASDVRGVGEEYANADKRRKDLEGGGNKLYLDGKRQTGFGTAEGWAVRFFDEADGDRAKAAQDLRSAIERERQFRDEARSKADKRTYENRIGIAEKAVEILEDPSRTITRKVASTAANLYEQTFFTNRATPEETERHLLKWYGKVSKAQKKWIMEQASSEGLDLSNIIWDGGEIQGAMLYNYLSGASYLGSPKAVSEFLARAGIDGIKYPVDSFGKTVKNGDEAGWNYVSFRDDNIRVDHKWVNGEQRYAIAGAVGASRMGLRTNADAEAMERSGATREEIWRETGWWRGADGKWRVEVPDIRAKRKPGPTDMDADTVMGVHFDGDKSWCRLGDMVNARDLFTAYPWLADTRVNIYDPETLGDGSTGGYNPATKEIEISQDLMKWQGEVGDEGLTSVLKGQEAVKTLAHEIQHAIQDAEGFTNGTSEEFELRKIAISAMEARVEASEAFSGIIRAVKNTMQGMEQKLGTRFSQDDISNVVFEVANSAKEALAAENADETDMAAAIQDAFWDALFTALPETVKATVIAESGNDPGSNANGWGYSRELADFSSKYVAAKLKEEAGENPIDAHFAAEDAYRKNEGEVEARNVEARLKMTPEERAATPPWETEDVEEGWQIVRYSVQPSRIIPLINGVLDGSLLRTDGKPIDIRGDRDAIRRDAKAILETYANERIPLPTGGVLYFAPTETTIAAYHGDIEKAWAEYAVHLATHQAIDAEGKPYRAYVSENLSTVLPRIREVVANDKVALDWKRKDVVFFKETRPRHYLRIVAHAGSGGNFRADLEYKTGYERKGRIPGQLTTLEDAVAAGPSEGSEQADATQASQPLHRSEVKPESGGARDSVAGSDPGWFNVAGQAEAAEREARETARHGLAFGGARFSNRSWVEAFAARDKALKIERSDEDYNRLIDALGLKGKMTAAEAREAAEALQREVKGGADVITDLVKAAEKKNFRQTVEKIVTAAHGYGIEVGANAYQAWERFLSEMRRTAKGRDAADFTNDTGWDLAELLWAANEAGFELQRKGKPAAEEGAPQEAGGATDEEMELEAALIDGREGDLGLTAAEARERLRKLAEERMGDMEGRRSRLRAALEAWRKSEAARIEKLRAEREAKEAAKATAEADANAGMDDRTDIEGKHKGERPEEENEDEAVEEMPDFKAFCERLKAEGLDLENPGEIAYVMRWYVEDWMAKKSGKAPGEVLKDPVAAAQYRRTVLQLLRDAANKLLDPNDGMAAKTVERMLGEIPGDASANEIQSRSRSIIGFLKRNAIRQSRKQLVKGIQDDITKQGIKGRKFDETEKDIGRKITGEREAYCRYLKRILNWGSQRIAAEQQRLNDIITGRLSAYKAARGEDAALEALAITDREIHRATERLNALQLWGGLRAKSPGEIARAGQQIHEWLGKERDEHEKRWADWMSANDERAARFAQAVSASMDDYTPDDPGYVGQLSDALTTNFRARLERLAVGSGAEGRRIIDELMMLVYAGSERLGVLKAQRRERTDAMLARCVEGTGQTVGEFLKSLNENIPEELNRTLATEEQPTRMTWGQALQLLGSLEQTASYQRNIDTNGRGTVGLDGEEQTPHRDLILAALANKPQMLRLVEEMRRIYDADREDISREFYAVTGNAVLTPDPLYLPARMFNGAGDNLETTVRAWNPFGPAFTPRIANKRDFNLSASIMDVYNERMKETATALAFGMRGMELRSVLARKSVQEAIAKTHGKFALRKMIAHLTDIVSDGYKGDGGQLEGYRKAIRAVGDLTTYSALSWNAVTMLKQMTSIPAWTALLDGGYGEIFHHIVHFDAAAAKELMASPGFIARYGADSFAKMFKQELDNPQGGNMLARFYKAGMTAVQMGDFVPGILVGQGVYKARKLALMRKGLAEGASREQAARETWGLIEENQQSSRLENTPEILRRGGFIGRQLSKFASSPMMQVGHEVHTLRMWLAEARLEARHGGKESGAVKAMLNARGDDAARWRKRFVNQFVCNHVLMPAAMYAIATVFKAALGGEPPDKEEVYGDLVMQMVAGPWSRIFLLGAVADTTGEWAARLLGGKPNVYSRGDLAATQHLHKAMSNAGRLLYDTMDMDWGSCRDDFVKMLSSYNAPFRYTTTIVQNATGYDPAQARRARKREIAKREAAE